MKTGNLVGRTIISVVCVVFFAISSGNSLAQTTPQAQPFFALSFFEMSNNASADLFAKYWRDTAHAVKTHGGVRENPIFAKGSLENAGSATIEKVDLEFTYMTIIRFENLESATAYFEDADLQKARAEIGDALVGNIDVVATIPDGVSDSIFSVEGLYEEKGFLLLNPMTFETDPEKMARLSEYSNVALPLVKSRGVKFFAPYIPVHIVQGETNMGMMYITNWPDMETFEAVHSDETWLSVMPARNEALSHLSDIHGEILRMHDH